MDDRGVFSSDHQAFRATIRRFIDEEIAPYHYEWKANGVSRASCGERRVNLAFFAAMFPNNMAAREPTGSITSSSSKNFGEPA